MPRLPLKLCAVPGCTKRVEQGRCAAHAVSHQRRYHEHYDRTRRDPADPLNTARWRMLRDAYLAEHPVCEVCGEWMADQVHHRVPWARGGDPFEWNNLQAVCTGCHAILSAAERRPVGGSNSRTRPPTPAQCPDAHVVKMARGVGNGR